MMTVFPPYFHRYLQDTRGAVAVEFALVGPMFLLLLVVAIELGVVLLTQSALDTDTQDASRLIMTGQVQTGGGIGSFTSKLCGDVGPLISNCASTVQINVQASAALANFSPTVKTNGAGTMTPTQFTPGTAGQYVLVQVGYNRPYLIAWVGSVLGVKNASLLVSSAVFQNERYQ